MHLISDWEGDSESAYAYELYYKLRKQETERSYCNAFSKLTFFPKYTLSTFQFSHEMKPTANTHNFRFDFFRQSVDGFIPHEQALTDRKRKGCSFQLRRFFRQREDVLTKTEQCENFWKYQDLRHPNSDIANCGRLLYGSRYFADLRMTFRQNFFLQDWFRNKLGVGLG